MRRWFLPMLLILITGAPEVMASSLNAAGQLSIFEQVPPVFLPYVKR